MPVMIFLVSLLVSMGVFVNAQGWVKNLAEQQVLMRSEGVFFTLDGEGATVVNQDVGVEEDFRDVHRDREAFQRIWYGRSGSWDLLDLELDQVVDEVEVRYCEAGDVCPEVVVEWFRVGAGYRFQRLEELEQNDFEVEALTPCLDIPRTRVRRCVRLRDQGDAGPLRFTENGFRLQVDYPAYGHLLRFWNVSGEEIRYEARAYRGGELVPLPNFVVEEDVQASSGAVQRRLRKQERLTGGLQPGLNYVHYSQTVENK